MAPVRVEASRLGYSVLMSADRYIQAAERVADFYAMRDELEELVEAGIAERGSDPLYLRWRLRDLGLLTSKPAPERRTISRRRLRRPMREVALEILREHVGSDDPVRVVFLAEEIGRRADRDGEAVDLHSLRRRLLELRKEGLVVEGPPDHFRAVARPLERRDAELRGEMARIFGPIGAAGA